MAEVRLEHVYKTYPGGVQAVNDFNLAIPDREFTVLVGPSDCGKFVAGFIGTQPMNFLTGALEERNGAVVWTDGHGVIRLADTVQSSLRQHTGKKAVLGVRPENIRDKALHGTSPEGSTVMCKVEVVEPLGDEQYVYLSEPKQPHNLIAKFDAHHRVAVGSEMEVVFDLDKVHVFDTTEGKNLTVGQGVEIGAGAAAPGGKEYN